jgi:hypothetical protein
LLRKTLDAVLAADAVGDWEQASWINWSRSSDPGSCGTSYCFAGWACALDGYTDMLPMNHDEARNPNTRTTVFIPEYAAHRLGLSATQSTKLFSIENGLEDLKHLVDDICAGEDV